MSIPPDPWLQQALRHTPDRAVAVPAKVREAILHEARHRAHVEPAREPQAGWRRLLAPWLRPARLGYSGAFMALAVLGVWGLGGLEDEARKAPAHESPATVVADLAVVAPKANAAPPAAASGIAAARESMASPVASPVAPPPARVAAATAGNKAVQSARPLRADAPVVAASPAAGALPEAVADAAAAPEPTPTPLPAAAPLTTAPTPAAALPVADPSATTRALDTLAQRGNAAPAPAGAPATARPSALSAPATAEASLARSAAPMPDPLGRPLLGTFGDGRWRWATPIYQGPHGDRQAAWLAALRSATAGRWAATNEAPPSTPPLRLVGGAGPTASLWLVRPGTVWVAVGDRTYRAALDEAELDALERLRAQW